MKLNLRFKTERQKRIDDICNDSIKTIVYKNKYPYFGESEEMIVLFSAKNEGTIICNEDNLDVGVFVDNLDESQFVRLEKGTMLEVVI